MSPRTPKRVSEGSFGEDLAQKVSRMKLSHDSTSSPDETTDMASSDPPPGPSVAEDNAGLLELPGEIRNRIYGYAVSVEGKIVVCRGKCKTPSLAKTCKQLRQEVPAIFYDTNTFKLDSIVDIQKWEPFATGVSRSCNSFKHWLHLDLESSIRHHHTIQEHGLQPTRILDEEMPYSEMRNYKPGGDSQIMAGVTVVWATHEKILLSLAENPRKKPFLSLRDLEMAAKERKLKGAFYV